MPKPGIPDPLDSLTPEALAHFHDLTKKLSAVRVLTVNDGLALSALAQATATFQECNRQLAKTGLVIQGEKGPIRNPWAILQKQALDQMQRGFVDFGLTPSSRPKVQAAPESAEKNPFANLG
jgi:P27 family predicted phage terminase small subunit